MRSTSAFVLAIALSAVRLAGGVTLPDLQRAGPPAVEIIYKVNGAEPLRLYMFQPAQMSSSHPNPALVWIHGGGWTSGDAKSGFPHARYFASRNMVSFSVEYRLARAHGPFIGQALEDCKDAVLYIRKHAAELNIDSKRVAIAGDSAGAHLAAALAAEDIPNAMLLYNGIYDLTGEDRSGLTGSAAASRKLSPLFAVHKGQAPAIVLHGLEDHSVAPDQSRRFAASMKAAGNRCDLILVENARHAFVLPDYTAPEHQVVQAIRDGDAFLASLGYTHGPPTLETAYETPAPDAAGMDLTRLAKIPKRMREFVDAGKTAGVVTLVARHGRIAAIAAVGFQDLESKMPMRTDTIFRLMSMTKPMTGTALMMLVEDGRVALIDPVEKYLPEFKGQRVGTAKPAHAITIEEILSHTSGIAGAPKGVHAKTLAEAVSIYARQPLDFEPGTSWRYRTEGTETVGRIIEVVSGLSYEQFMRERIFQPLGMRDSTFFPSDEQRGRIATVYTAVGGKLERAPMRLPNRDETYAGPGSGAFSTAGDMARFYQMVLNHGVVNGKRLLSAEAIDVMTSVHTGDLNVGFAPGMGYGLAWGVIREQKGRFRLSSVGSFGHGGAYRTYGWVDPAKDMFSVLMMQRTNDGGDVADEINAFLAMAAAAIDR